MTTIVTRATKGLPLTWAEADSNFNNLNTDKIELTTLSVDGGSDLVGFIQAGIGSVSRTVQDKLREPFITPQDFGALGDGVADDTTAIKNAILSAKAGSGVVFFPKGKYRVTTGGISIAGVSLIGCGIPEFGNTYDDDGSVILLDSTTVTPFTLGLAWSIVGLTFYYPNQDGSAATPIVYPPTFTGTYVAGGYMENCTVVNAYQVFKFTSGTAVGDLKFISCRIYGIDKVFWFQQGVPETISISHCLFSHGVFVPSHTPNKYLRDYTSASGEFITIDISGSSWTSIDGLNLSDNLIFGYRYGIHVISGLLNVSVISNNWFDNVRTALRIDSSGTLSNTRWIDNYHWSMRPGFVSGSSGTYGYNTTDDTISVASSGGGSGLYVSGNDFVYSMGNHIYWNSLSFLDVKITDNRFVAWGMDAVSAPTTYYAIGATDSALNGSISLNKFQATAGVVAHNKTGIAIGNAADVVISVNEFDSCFISCYFIAATKIKAIGNVSSGTTHTNSVLNLTASGVLESSGNKWDKVTSGPSGVPAFCVNAGTQTFTGAKTQITYTNAEIYDQDANISSGTFTAPVAGVYEFTAQLNNTTGVTIADVWNISLEQTGSSTVVVKSSTYVPANIAGSAPLHCFASFNLAAGDTVKAYVENSSGTGNYVSSSEVLFNIFTGKKLET